MSVISQCQSRVIKLIYYHGGLKDKLVKHRNCVFIISSSSRFFRQFLIPLVLCLGEHPELVFTCLSEYERSQALIYKRKELCFVQFHYANIFSFTFRSIFNSKNLKLGSDAMLGKNLHRLRSPL